MIKTGPHSCKNSNCLFFSQVRLIAVWNNIIASSPILTQNLLFNSNREVPVPKPSKYLSVGQGIWLSSKSFATCWKSSRLDVHGLSRFRLRLYATDQNRSAINDSTTEEANLLSTHLTSSSCFLFLDQKNNSFSLGITELVSSGNTTDANFPANITSDANIKASEELVINITRPFDNSDDGNRGQR